MTTLYSSTRERSVKRRLLTYYFLYPRERLYLRELAAKLKADPSNLHRDLRALEKEGIFVSQQQGMHKYFSLNPDYPLLPELKAFTLKRVSERSLAHDVSQKYSGKRQSVYVLAGPNGAGKTTFAQKFLPGYVQCRQFVNADLIAGGLSPFSPETSALQAGKLLLEQIGNLAQKGSDFGFETTLAGKSYVRLFSNLRDRGYGLHLFFLWIPNAEMALQRIKERGNRGGHSIPEPVVRRRFARGIQNLFSLYRPFLASWRVFDNSTLLPYEIFMENENGIQIFNRVLFDKITRQAGVKIQ